MEPISSPFFCLTSDVDWASDYAIGDFLALVSSYHIKPTIFATHKSRVLEESCTNQSVDTGIHPNFLPGSSHGSDMHSVIDRMCTDFPEAKTFRAHSFFDHSQITLEMVRRGFRYDSNLCLHLQPNIVPLRHASGLVRLPVFWEDDVHWTTSCGDWDLDKYLHHFFSPGLKILNFHPFFIAANIPSQEYYFENKIHITTLASDTIDRVRYRGEGARTFFIKLLNKLTAAGPFYSLAQLYEMFPLDQL